MSGAHRSTTQSAVASARKSAAWMLKLGAAVAAMLVLVAAGAFVIYFVITQPPKKWPLPVGISCAIVVGLYFAGDVTLRRMKRRQAASGRPGPA
jgi:uncharacterized integral membrane protein